MENGWEDGDDDGVKSSNSDQLTQGEQHGHNAKESSWAPFSNLEQIVGLLIVGSSRIIMLLLQYERVRSFLHLLKVKLPAYKTLQLVRQKLKKMFEFDVSESLSALGKPCFGLRVKQILTQELANPYVMEHLEFIPELPTSTSKINRFTQSKKWREDLEKNLRVQMVNSPKGHFFLYEPVQLESKRIVIPMFFYGFETQVFAKCVFARQTAHLNSEGCQRIRVEFPSVSSFNSSQLSSINVKYFA
ncbi:hypothetical protein DFH28DRAFT_902343 [Melampsora americana]|nr:hypothetical protein DFH28DRAFT_902343 [Melampsora americana]